MNYRAHYDNLISTRKRRVRSPEIYYERHHILPKSMGGSNDPENLIFLTAREHFIAHWLLWRIYSSPETAYAFFAMCAWKQKDRIIVSSHAYEESREACAKMMSLDEKRSISTTNRNLKFWQSMTTEERSVFAEKMHEGQRRMTPAARSERARKGANSQWKNVTDEEKKVRMKNLHKMTPEKRKAISDGHQRRKALKLAASL